MKTGRKVTVFTITMLLFVNVFNFNVFAGTPTEPRITEKFVSESDYSVQRDNKGSVVITLTNMQPLPSTLQLGTSNFAKTSVAILPFNEQEANDIIANIESLRRRSGSATEDEWFYGSSVYLKSTINYSTTTVSGLEYGQITNVTISATTNSGSSISSMSLLMGQNGWAPGGFKQQRQTFNATTARSFTRPSSWVAVLWDGTGDVGAHLTCTAIRQSGQSTFTLYNSIQ